MTSLNDDYPELPAIYLLVEKETGNTYVGSTNNARKRLISHKSCLNRNVHRNKSLQDSFNKNPDLEVVCAIVEDKEMAESLEQNFLDEHMGSGQMMNVASRADSPFLSPEIRSKIIEVNTGRIFSQETRDKISKASKGRKHTDEVRQKISKHHQGHLVSQETRDKISEARIGKKFTQEQRNRLSEIRKGVKQSEEHKLKRAAAKEIPVIINGIKHRSFSIAALELGISSTTVARKIADKKYPDWIKA